MCNIIRITENSAILPENLTFKYKSKWSDTYEEKTILVNYACAVKNEEPYFHAYTKSSGGVWTYKIDNIEDKIKRCDIEGQPIIHKKNLKTEEQLRLVFFFIDEYNMLPAAQEQRDMIVGKKASKKGFSGYIAKILAVIGKLIKKRTY